MYVYGYRKSEGLSGRSARKIPFLAHALHLQCPTSTLAQYLQAMELAVEQEFKDRALVGKTSDTSSSK
jgi:hypothetical protein